MDPLPITINKSVWGQVGIALGGVAAILLVVVGLLTGANTPGADPLILFGLGTFVIVLIAAFTAIWLRVYSLSYLYLAPAGVQAVYYPTLFHRQTTDNEWSDVEDVSAVTSGFFAQMLSFGTVNIQTAGTRQNIRMVMVPNAERVREIIQYYQDQATP